MNGGLPALLQIVQDRTGSRLADYLELLADDSIKRRRVDLGQVLDQWQEWVTSPATGLAFPAPTDRPPETHLLLLLDRAWLAFQPVVSRPIGSAKAVLRTPEWRALQAAAQAALLELRRTPDGTDS